MFTVSFQSWRSPTCVTPAWRMRWKPKWLLTATEGGVNTCFYSFRLRYVIYYRDKDSKNPRIIIKKYLTANTTPLQLPLRANK